MREDLQVLLGLLLITLLAWGGQSVTRFSSRWHPAFPKVLSVSDHSPVLEWTPGESSTVIVQAAQKRGVLPGWVGLLLGIPLDLNKASAEDLDVLPGVGPKMAEEIVQFRRRNGGFGTAEILLRARGVGPKTLERLRPWVVIPDHP